MAEVYATQGLKGRRLPVQTWSRTVTVTVTETVTVTATVTVTVTVTAVLTSARSFPCILRYALVHLTLRGLRFILKFLWHLDRQNRNVCAPTHAAQQEAHTTRRAGTSAVSSSGSVQLSPHLSVP